MLLAVSATDMLRFISDTTQEGAERSDAHTPGSVGVDTSAGADSG